MAKAREIPGLDGADPFRVAAAKVVLSYTIGRPAETVVQVSWHPLQ